jgi:hypothetical protein
VLVVANVASYFTLSNVLFSSYYVSWYLGALIAEGEATGLLSEQLSSLRLRAAFYTVGFAFLCAGCAVFFIFQYIAFQVWAMGFAVYLFSVFH